MASSVKLIKKNTNHYLSINDVLIFCLAMWPLTWNILGCLQITSSTLGSRFSIYLFWLITFITVVVNIRFKASYLLIWFIFIGFVLLESFNRLSSSVLFNLSILICCVLLCIFLHNKPINTVLLLKCLYFCGFFILITVFLDLFFSLFQKTLIGIYTYRAATAKHTVSFNSGLLPYTSSAGGYICMGAAAYITLLRMKNRKWKWTSWVVIALFALGFLVLRKRGFTLDIAISLIVIWFFSSIFNKKSKSNLKRNLRIIAVLVLALVAGVVLYYVWPVFHDIVSSFLEHFTKDDETLSGRTVLYDLAWRQFKAHPIFGIGWGNYRQLTLGIYSSSSDKTYAAHNVYLQLLCETGITGTAIFLVVVITTLVMGIRRYRYLVNKGLTTMSVLLQCALFFELFFLTYCISGNPLYDYNFLVFYFFGVLITLGPENNPKITRYLMRSR